MKAKRTAHTVYQLAYHFVWVPKYRRKILTGDVAKRLKEIIREICAEYDWEIEALEVMVDHVHLFVSCPPRYAPAQVMNTLKSLTGRALYEEFPRLKKVLWGGQIWADGYYVGSSGEHVTSDLIRHYIEYQKAEDVGPKQLRLFDPPSARSARPKRAPR
jgi:REP-associated tyrosine transposase